jgi:homocysteine S-methyltransferase
LACRGRYTTEAGALKQPYSDGVGSAVAFGEPGESVLISDGGLATELEARGHDLSDPLWSARLLADAPGEIVAVHAAYFRAGAGIATTASYQASFEGFAARGVDRGEATGLLRRSVELAKAARDETGASGVRVAASVGPYGAALADGSEYRGRYGLSVAALTRWHRPRLEVLAAAGADVLALETVPDVDEAQALVNLVRSVGVPAWLSYTIDGPRTRAGQPLEDAFAVAAGVDEIAAVGVNCCAPDDVLPAIRIARAVGKPVIVYPNSGERWDSRRGNWMGPRAFSAQLASQWAAAGASIIGGCCRVGPAEIADLRRALAASDTETEISQEKCE